MTQQPPGSNNPSEGMASLQVAQAHLSTLLTAVDALDSKTMFLAAVNLALFTLFAGIVFDRLSTLWWFAPPLAVLVVNLILAWFAVRPHEIQQFNDPEDLLDNRDGGFNDHNLAWAYVVSISLAATNVRNLLARKSSAVRWLAVFSGLHALTLVVCALLGRQLGA